MMVVVRGGTGQGVRGQTDSVGQTWQDIEVGVVSDRQMIGPRLGRVGI